AGLQGLANRGRVIDRQRRLREEGEARGRGHGDRLGLLDRLDQGDGARRHLAESADYLRMAGVADEEDVAAFLNQPLRLTVNLRDERACGVDIGKTAGLCCRRHRLGHAMRGKDDRPVIRYLVKLVYEHSAETAQAI